MFHTFHGLPRYKYLHWASDHRGNQGCWMPSRWGYSAGETHILFLFGRQRAPHPVASPPPPPAVVASPNWIMDLTLWQYQFRIIMLGDSTVGKSSMLKRYTEDLFMECLNQTVGVDFYVHFLEVEPDVRVKLQFWDTAGQERFRWGCVCVYSWDSPRGHTLMQKQCRLFTKLEH